MPKLKSENRWRGKATDIAYKEPFSESTNRIRKQLMFWSSIALLNHFYPINLKGSHVFGFEFSSGKIPPIDGLLGLIATYLSVVFGIYVYQEVMSWLAQANEVALVEYRRSLHDIYAHHQGIFNAVNNVTNQLKRHKDSVVKLRDTISSIDKEANNLIRDSIDDVELQKRSFENFCLNLRDSDKKFGEDVEKANVMLSKVTLEYKAALASQLIKVGLLEVFIPLVLGLCSVGFSCKSVINLLISI